MTFQPVNSLLSWFILPSETVFHNLCTVLYWRLCSLTKAPLLNTISQLTLMCIILHWAQKVFSNNGFRMVNCFCCLSQNAMVCLAHCRQELQRKPWKTARLFRLDALASSVIATATWLGDWLAVRYSWYCIKTTKPILKLFRPSDSPIIEAFGNPYADTKFQGEPLHRGR